jgi:hypothetical protein
MPGMIRSMAFVVISSFAKPYVSASIGRFSGYPIMKSPADRDLVDGPVRRSAKVSRAIPWPTHRSIRGVVTAHRMMALANAGGRSSSILSSALSESVI